MLFVWFYFESSHNLKGSVLGNAGILIILKLMLLSINFIMQFVRYITYYHCSNYDVIVF